MPGLASTLTSSLFTDARGSTVSAERSLYAASSRAKAARRAAFRSRLPEGGEALRSLDVTLLGVALEVLAGLDAAAIAGGSVAFTKSAADAVATVDERLDEVDAAFLLDGTPVASIEAVARDGDVMPQKSTYFYPKALTGLVINPHEW